VLWVTPKILKKLSAKAPDFWSWRGGVFRFSASPVLPENFTVDLRETFLSVSEPSVSDLEIEELLVRVKQIEQQDPDSLSLATLFDRLGQAYTNRIIGNHLENKEKAIEYYQTVINIQTKLNLRSSGINTLIRLAALYLSLSRYQEATELLQRSLQLSTELGDRSGVAISRSRLGKNELGRGNFEAAEAWIKKALAVMENLQLVDSIAETNWDLAQVYRSKPDHQKAQEHYEKAHQLFTELGAKKDLERIEANWNSTLD
jgi:tetratricopeptide (TPR) repeat protein